jgi:3'(2'), 5'-bisphosphate nucleotidase
MITGDCMRFLELVKEVSVEAGKAILEIYKEDNPEIQMKENDSPLTRADKASHFIIYEKLKLTGLNVLSEEGKEIPYETRKDWEYYWLVDPLDGTKEFIKKNGEFTVNIALIHNGLPVLGVVYVPVFDTLYWGVTGEGAYKQTGRNQPQHLSVRKDTPVRVIVASRSHLSKETSDFINNYPDAELISMGSSLKFLLVAEGKAQIYPRFAPTMEWDTAAAQAIVESAGGKVLNYPQKTRLTYNRSNMLNGWFICSN